MSNLYIPICAFFISILMLVIFFSKENVKNDETNIFSKLLIINFLDIVTMIIILLIGYQKIKVNSDILAILLNKFDFMLYLFWARYFFLYMFNISFRNKNNLYQIIKKVTLLSNIIVSLLMIFLQTKLYNVDNVMYSYGPSVVCLYISCGIYFLFIFISILINYKNITSKKYYPLYSLLVLALLIFIIRSINPGLLIISAVLTYINLIMYFTIENPDVKMLKEMEISKTQAEKANRAKSDFLSSMSHEIRTPLNAIVGLSEDIDSFKDQVPPQVVEDTEDIRSASKTLLEIVGNILDINKIESQKMELTNEVYNPRETIETLAKIDATRIGEKSIDFKVNIAEDLPYELIGDKTHLKQILNNLLSNAFKYTEKGEVNLTVKCVNQNDYCNLMISVQDTGRGIKAEDINKLFTKFERLDVEMNSTTEGTGLGLAITKSLVEMMGGKINVQSQFGKGSIFVVNIVQKIKNMTNPLTDTQAIKLDEIRREKLKNTSYGIKKVLIVDDNKLNIKVARRALANFNFEIEECYDGVECLSRVVNGNEYDLILMDIMMPNMSGETAIAKLKENPNFNIPTIALTADAVAGAKEKYISLGFIDYIAKPFTREQIKEKLDFIFSNKNKEKNKFEDVATYVIGDKDIYKD